MDDLGESVWCLVDIKVGSASTEVCDCKKSENKSAIITKKMRWYQLISQITKRLINLVLPKSKLTTFTIL